MKLDQIEAFFVPTSAIRRHDYDPTTHVRVVKADDVQAMMRTLRENGWLRFPYEHEAGR